MNKIHIELEESQKVWFTSDLHFGHNNICKPTFANRPWEDAKEMGPALISNWNEKVGDDDIAFILGDVFWFNNSQSIKRVLSKLKGKDIYIIAGNHDDFTAYHRVTDERIHLLGDIVTVWITNYDKSLPGHTKEVILCHYPLATYAHKDRGALQFFGHIHSGERANNKIDIIGQDLHIAEKQQVDVGCDNWNYSPVEFRELLYYLKSK